MIRIGTAALAIPALPAEDDWRLRSACTTDDADLFFGDSHAEAIAKSICHGCPVIQQCAQWALDTRQEFGVFGGLDDRQRRAILRRQGAIKPRGGGRAPAPCGTRAAYDRHRKNGEPIDNLCATQGRYSQPLKGASLPPTAAA